MKFLFILAATACATLAQGETTAKKEAKTPADKAPAAKARADKETEEVNEGPSAKGPRAAAVSSIRPEELAGFEHYAPQIQELVRKALDLTKLNLTYTYGSSDPKRGGMDCSGTIFHLLDNLGLEGTPRASNEMAGWVQEKTLLHRIRQADSLKHPEFAVLQPGDLLFWSGTYQTAPRKIPVTHVMVYLGKLKKGGKPVVFGASDGRSYQGQRRTGVSVFDFILPKSTSESTFYGYGLIPEVGKIAPTPAPVENEVVSGTKPDAGNPADEGEKPTDSTKTGSDPVTSTATTKEASKPAAPDKTAGSSKSSSKSKTTGPSKASSSKSKSKTKATGASKSSSSKASTTGRKKTASAPPRAFDKAKAATGSFLEEVRKAMPSATATRNSR